MSLISYLAALKQEQEQCERANQTLKLRQEAIWTQLQLALEHATLKTKSQQSDSQMVFAREDLGFELACSLAVIENDVVISFALNQSPIGDVIVIDKLSHLDFKVKGTSYVTSSLERTIDHIFSQL